MPGYLDFTSCQGSTQSQVLILGLTPLMATEEESQGRGGFLGSQGKEIFGGNYMIAGNVVH